MNLLYVGILVTIFVINSVVGDDPTLVVKYKKLTPTTIDNPYFGEFTTEISEDGILGSAFFQIKKSFPDTATVSVTIELEGNQIADYEDALCEMIKNEIYGKDIIEHGVPADEFPESCPVIAGDYGISKYPLPKDKFPDGTPSGDYVAKMFFGEPDRDPWVIIDAIIEVSHQSPKVPTLGF